jgi:hypothetical protein
MTKLKFFVFMIKMILTICATIIFNQFITANFTINIVSLFLISLIFSMGFYSFITNKSEIVNDTKDLMK